MEHRSSRRAFAFGAAGGLAGTAFLRTPAGAAEYSWKFGSANTADHPANVALAHAFSKIREETSGRFEIKPYLNSSLGTDPAMLTQLRAGALEMMTTSGATFDTLIPTASIESVAFAFQDHKTAFEAMDGDMGKIVRNQFPDKGFIALAKTYENGFRYFTSSPRPIRAADDLQGMKLRVSPGKLYFDTFHSLGASVTTLGISEAYVSLQTHLIDAQETTMTSIENQRLYEVQRYCSLSRHMWSGYWFLIGRDRWEALPRNLQEIAEREIDGAAAAQRRANAIAEAAVRDKLERQGLIFNPIDLASFKAKLIGAGYYTRWRDTYGPAAWASLEKYSGRLG